MKFAKIVFWIAGLMGLAAVIPMYYEPGTYVYYGVLAAIVAVNAGFLIIGWDPQRFRPMMIPAVIEKLLWSATLLVFYARAELAGVDTASNVIPHALLGFLFLVAYFRVGQTAGLRRTVGPPAEVA